jgi:hypothetical protein
MSTYGKRKGAAFETGILKWLRSKGLLAERLSKAGSNDEGDIVCFVAGKPMIFELKARVKLDLPQFWREATVEAGNYAKARGLEEAPPTYVIVKRASAGLDQAWVIQTLDQWVNNNKE